MWLKGAQEACPEMVVIPTSADLFAELAATAEITYELLYQVTHRIQVTITTKTLKSFY